MNSKKVIFFLNVGFIFLSCSFLFVACSSSPNLEWHIEEHHRWAEVDPGYFGSTGFKALTSSQTNIQFENHITEKQIAENRHYLNGSGVAAGDVDGDGLADLYFAQLDGPNKLYKNMGGMEFKDITDSAGVAHRDFYSTGAVFADINGDDFPDLLITAMHKQNVLYINDGSGGFQRKEDSGLGAANGSTTMALADIDGDDDLDLYISNYKEKSIKDTYSTDELAWENILKGDPSSQDSSYKLIPPFDDHYELFIADNGQLAGVVEAGEVDKLYLNEGDGSFQKISDSATVFLDENGNPTQLQRDWGLAAKFQDINDDGLPDLYVSNDFYSPDRIWLNQGDGTFKAISWPAIRNGSFSSMAVDFSDINKDGETDIFVTEMLSQTHSRRMRQMGVDDPSSVNFHKIKARPKYNRNSLYLQREDTTFAEISYFSGLEASEWSWATRFMDIDLDGYEDLIINTGYTYDILDIDTQFELQQMGVNMDDQYGEFISRTPPLDLPNRMFKNNSGDLTFSDKSSDWGFEKSDVSHGLATADFDNDGDLDFAINRLQKPALVYENRTTAPRIAVRLKGNNSNTHGIGAKVKLEGGPQPQEKEITASGDYLSGSSPIAVFAANEESNQIITVTWPDGTQSKIDSVKANRIYEIDQAGAKPAKKEQPQTTTNVIFKDVSNRINHQHHEDNFDDFRLQPLLPKKLSELGPGLAWIDYDNDQDDDLFITSGKGGTMGAFENRGDGSFRSIENPVFDQTAEADRTTVLGWNTRDAIQLVVGNANYETGNINLPSAYSYQVFPENSTRTDDLQGVLSTTGPMAAADYNQDGDVDLFIGGRFVPGQYPNSATSRLFTSENGSFQFDQTNSTLFQNEGLVTGAVFTDYDRDGDADLLLSLEWGSLKLFENNNGRFREVTRETGLDSYKGLWNGVTTGDFNNDGLPDIVATNQGLNSSYQLDNDQPLRIYYDDFSNNGRTNIIEAYANKKNNYVPRRKLYNYNNISAISSMGLSYQEFGNTTLQDIFGDRLSRIPYKSVNTLAHTVFINTGEGFEAYSLPVEAQFSTAYYVGVADFNNDGNEDMFLSQNFFDVPRQVPRQDAGRGLWLKGDGSGSFTPVPAHKSGIKIYGEQRGAGFSDFNSDGKVDLAVTQNGAETKLYLNQTDKAGLRVRLDGLPDNKSAIGSSLRLVYADGSEGSLREIQAGSGYWSQNSAVQVLGMRKEVQQIRINWYDGTHQTVDASSEQIKYVISHPGNSQVKN